MRARACVINRITRAPWKVLLIMGGPEDQPRMKLPWARCYILTAVDNPCPEGLAGLITGSQPFLDSGHSSENASS